MPEQSLFRASGTSDCQPVAPCATITSNVAVAVAIAITIAIVSICIATKTATYTFCII